MGLETATYINGLVTTNPTSSDPKSQGDDHLRLVKSTVKATFPNITGAVTPTQTDLNVLLGSGTTPTLGGAVYGTGSAYAATAAGTAGQVLTSNGASAPTWQTSSGSSGLKNRIINGAMTIDQRNAGASIANPAAITTYTLDRWNIYGTLASKFTCQQASASPPSGFANYMAFTSSAATVAAATDLYAFATKVEGFNTADFAWGTASAKSVTLSFRVYSSLTGTFGASIGNNAANRNYVFSYSIPVASTWTTISVTIPGDTSGTWLVNNSVGVQMYFDLGSGTSLKTTAGTWGSTFYYGVTGGVNVVATNAATFYITGVQLEIGSVATPFEQRPYGMELALCQRYYQEVCSPGTASQYFLSGGMMTSTTAATVIYRSIVPFRANPTLTYSALADFNIYAGTAVSATSALTVLTQIDPKYQNINFTASSALTNGAPVMYYTNTTTARIALSAEL